MDRTKAVIAPKVPSPAKPENKMEEEENKQETE